MKILFETPWDCQETETYDTKEMPVPRVGERVLVWTDPTKRKYLSSPDMPRQVPCVVSVVEYDLTSMSVTVTLETP